MRSHGLRQLVDDKPAESYQQTCCKLIVKTCYPQHCCKLFQQVVISLQMTICSKLDFNRQLVVNKSVAFLVVLITGEVSATVPSQLSGVT